MTFSVRYSLAVLLCSSQELIVCGRSRTINSRIGQMDLVTENKDTEAREFGQGGTENKGVWIHTAHVIINVFAHVIINVFAHVIIMMCTAHVIIMMCTAHVPEWLTGGFQAALLIRARGFESLRVHIFGHIYLCLF